VTAKNYPQTPEEWQATIQNGIGINQSEGQKALQEGKFAYEQFAQWIREIFSDGFSPDFIPALLRNIRGLVEWVYGDGDEPFWPGSDDDSVPG